MHSTPRLRKLRSVQARIQSAGKASLSGVVGTAGQSMFFGGILVAM